MAEEYSTFAIMGVLCIFGFLPQSHFGNEGGTSAKETSIVRVQHHGVFFVNGKVVVCVHMRE